MAATLDLSTGKSLANQGYAARHLGRRFCAWLRAACQRPRMAAKPSGLPISDRAWRRNSAFILSFCEEHGRPVE